MIFVEVGDIVPCDGKVIEVLALADESARTGESVPVIKEACEEFNTIIRGTRIVSNWLKIKVTTPPAASHFDKVASVLEKTAI
ncbi:hypothetical protein JMF89_12545 [Clostridiaceae bacterium UIB06]|uniref:P-type ATPase A domain-containing protein n=1 Tax=Clostridium thailandense TaxID=2794346 RepID=A0A949WWA2_9CLOT|nr:hypothetical protein [Clostridium thailandense]MCH5138029.1 hypothetical protein [Clostridiaceae bacterium UIB06]